MINLILGVLGVLTGWFTFIFGKDLYKNKKNLENNSFAINSGIGLVANFFDTLGIGSFAIITAAFRGFKQVKDRVIPGTLNVSCTIPIVFQAFVFMGAIEVEIVTLVTMILAAVVGAYLGAGVVSQMDERKIQLIMGIALLTTAFLMVSGQMGWMPIGGNAIGLTGIKLALGILGNFILGALMTAGIGLYAPCMALIYVLGMSPDVAFPIMMGSCAFLMPVASAKFIKEQAYDRKAAIAITLSGIIGVFIAAFIVKSLPIRLLTWLVVTVITYTGGTLLYSALNNDDDPNKKVKNVTA